MPSTVQQDCILIFIDHPLFIIITYMYLFIGKWKPYTLAVKLVEQGMLASRPVHRESSYVEFEYRNNSNYVL